MNIVLGTRGESTLAVVTNIRREGGERTDIKPGRYTYNVSYVFTLPNGKEISGFSKKIGNGVYLKADGSGRIPVKYFEAMPYLNSLAEDVQHPFRQIILIGIGVLLIFFINRN